MYHRVCLNKLYKTASNLQLYGYFTDRERKFHGNTFGKFVLFLEEIITTDTIPAFKLLDLTQLYDAQLKDLRITLEAWIHSTRFKNCFLSQFEDMSAHNEAKEVILVFNHSIAEAITTAAGINYDDDGYILCKCFNMVYRT